MKLNVKIIVLLIVGFFVVSTILTISSIVSLQNNQNDNIRLFKQQLMELARESFNENTNLVFTTVESQIHISTSSSTLMSSIESIDPDDLWIYSIPLKKYIYPPKNELTGTILNEATLNRYIQANTLNLTKTFDLDNFQEFINNSTTINPIKIQSRVYPDSEIIVGYTKTFTTSKVRIDFVQRQDTLLFYSFLYSSIITVLIVLVVSIATMIFFMQTVVISPLKKISNGIEQVRKGLLGIKIDIKRKDEIGDIANAFNEMTQDLDISNKKIEEYNTSLEQKIADRTNDLNSKVNELETLNKLMLNRELKMIDLKKQIQDLEEQKNK